MKKRIVTLLLSGLLILLTASSFCLTASADDALCTLTLNCSVRENETDTAVAGDTFAVVKIADCTVIQSKHTAILRYTTVERFKAFDCRWTALTALQLAEKAEALCSAVGEEDRVDIQTTDSRGTARFDLREPGLYLVVRTAAKDVGITYQPFLISVPQLLDGALVYDVSAAPKFGNKHITPVGPPDNGGRLPQTGRIFWPIIVFAAVGVLLTAAGIRLLYGAKKHEKDQ